MLAATDCPPTSVKFILVDTGSIVAQALCFLECIAQIITTVVAACIMTHVSVFPT